MRTIETAIQDTGRRAKARRNLGVESSRTEVYDSIILGIPTTVIRGVEDMGAQIHINCLQALKPLGDADRHLFMALMCSIREALAKACRAVLGDPELAVARYNAPANDKNRVLTAMPEDWDMPERVLIDIEVIIDGIEEQALRRIKALPEQSRQFDVVAFLAAVDKWYKPCILRKVITEKEARKRAIAFARNQLSEPYSITASKWSESKWYCSLLIYKSYSRTVTGMYLETYGRSYDIKAGPMVTPEDLVDSPRSQVYFTWKKKQ